MKMGKKSEDDDNSNRKSMLLLTNVINKKHFNNVKIHSLAVIGKNYQRSHDGVIKS